MAVQISGNDITVPRDGSFTRNVTIGGTLTYEDVTNIDSVGLVTARTGIEIGARPGVAASISVDGNMIVSGISTFGDTIKGTAGIFSGAANVSYEALKLVNTQHDTNAEGAAAIKFGITNSLGERNARIEAKEESNNTNDVGLDFYTNSTSGVDSETLKMRVTAAGKVGIGISSPTGQFAVSDGTRIAEINPHSSGTFIGNRSNHDVLFQVNAATKAKIDTNGHLTISDGDLVIGTAGHGIDFSATSDASGATSELLADYERGTFNVTVPENGSGNQTVTNNPAGRYTKIGDFVYIYIYAIFSGAPQNNTSGWQIGGLPYTPSTSGFNHHGMGQIQYTETYNYSVWRPLISSSNRIYFHRTDGSNSSLLNQDVVSIGMTYFLMGAAYMTA